jgi:hypothetical protein
VKDAPADDDGDRARSEDARLSHDDASLCDARARVSFEDAV